MVYDLYYIEYTVIESNEPSSIDYRNWGFHAQGVYPTQDTSSIGTARVKQDE